MEFVMAVVAVAATASLMAPGRSAPFPSSPLEEAGVADLTLDGLRIGDNRDAVLRHWGTPLGIEPHELARYGGEEEQRYRLWRYAGARTAMLRDDRVVNLSSDSGVLACSGRRLPGPGDRADDVEQILGPSLPDEYAVDQRDVLYATGDGTGGLYYELKGNLVEEVTLSQQTP